MDHFARPGDELAVAQRNRTLHRNFQGYTTKAGADLYGMGVSAISGFDAAYAQSYREIPAYSDAVVRRGIGTMRGYRMTEDDRLRRAVISRLLCHTVIHKNEIEREFGITSTNTSRRNSRNSKISAPTAWSRRRPNEIRVTPLGRVFIRNLGMIFDRYLREQQMDARPLFSKTL